MHERYRRQTTDSRQTDGRATAYSERERELIKPARLTELTVRTPASCVLISVRIPLCTSFLGWDTLYTHARTDECRGQDCRLAY